MKNRIFTAEIGSNGGLSVLKRTDDPTGMNFVKSGYEFFTFPDFVFIEKTETDSSASCLFKKDSVSVRVDYKLTDALYVDIFLTDTDCVPVYFNQGDFAVNIPLADSYDDSVTCMKERCHAHIWAGLNSCYVRAVRMGDSDFNLGLVMNGGSIASYSQAYVKPNDRGIFLLDASAFYLNPKETKRFSFTVFPYDSDEKFFSACMSSPEFIRINSPDGYTLIEGESTEFTATVSAPVTELFTDCSNGTVSTKISGNTVKIKLTPKTAGECKVFITINGNKTYAAFNVLPALDGFIEKRLNRIVDEQQCLDPNSPLFGAFLIYDNRTKTQYFYNAHSDYNACRERLGMGILLATFLQTHHSEKLTEALRKHTEFVKREFVDYETGEVYNTIGKISTFKRLYNIPWATLYFTEIYNLTHDETCLDFIYKSLKFYYENGGTKFYPNGIRFAEFMNAFRHGGKTEEFDEIMSLFDKHIANIVKNGTCYPPHEVNFEQTIVTPAVTLLLDKYELSGDAFYLHEAEKHLNILRRFDGDQPHYRLNKTPIRYWDDYFFGKTHTYGDTFPHYWSSLSGTCFYRYGRLNNNAKAAEYGKQCLLNTLCVVNADGIGSCAHVYPFRVLGNRYRDDMFAPLSNEFISGEFDDDFANDQDFALYFALKAFL